MFASQECNHSAVLGLQHQADFTPASTYTNSLRFRLFFCRPLRRRCRQPPHSCRRQ